MNSKRRRKSPTTKRRIAAYVRVSTQRQATEGDSLEAQQNAINRYLELHFGQEKIEYVRLYVEAGKSAKDQKRPQLQKLRSDISKGEIDTVVCFKLDRITRSILDFADLWSFFDMHGVEFISLQERVDSSTAMGKAMLFIIMVFAQLEREMTGERTLATMHDRITRGLWNGGYVYGYMSDPDGSGKLVPDPEWAKIIKEKFFDALERLGSAGAVQRELSDKWKIKVPKHKSRSSRIVGGTPFTKQQVIRILRNEIYLGRLSWGDQVQDNCHTAIITQEQFDRVQRILDETTKHRSNRRKSRGRGYSLRGLIRCACGAMMTPKGAHGRNGKYHYYECTQKIHVGRTACRAAGIPAESLEEAVAARVADLGTNEEARKQIIAQALKLIDSNAHAAEEESLGVRNRLTTVKSEIGRLITVLKEMGAGVLKSIKDELTRLEEEKQELEIRLEELLQEKMPLDQMLILAKKFIQSWEGVGELLEQATGDERRIIIEQHVEVIQMTPIAADGKSGTYVLRLFPEATPDRAAGNDASLVAPESANGDPVLTESPPVREVGEKAPRTQHVTNDSRATRSCKARIGQRLGKFESSMVAQTVGNRLRTLNPRVSRERELSSRVRIWLTARAT